MVELGMHEDTQHLQYTKIIHLMQIGHYDKALQYLENTVRLYPHHKKNREENMAMLQNKYKVYRVLTWSGKLPPVVVLVFWIIGWFFFRPLVIAFFMLYVISHWVTKLIVHVKIFGWNFRRT